ncbi:hypothetical protein PENSPDRAFT_665317 [Peniophora sp. CONT]|nr:hypothetical protein PENSPDRAFT_665317 [Peniophora sp. CONT]
MDAATASASASASLLEYYRALDFEKKLNEHQRTVLRNVTCISELVCERRNHRRDDDHNGPRPHKMLKTPETEGDVVGDDAAPVVSKAAEKHASDAQTRANAFLADALRADAQAVSLAELTALVVNGISTGISTKLRDHAPLEDAALHRTLVGYTALLDDKNGAVPWGPLRRGAALMSAAPLAGENHDPQSPLVVFCARSLDLERDGDLERRVCKRGGWLSVDPFGGARWVTELVQKIEVLRFDLDYNLLIAGEGGKKRQSDIHERLFQAWLPKDKKDVEVKTSEGDALKKSY